MANTTSTAWQHEKQARSQNLVILQLIVTVVSSRYVGSQNNNSDIFKIFQTKSKQLLGAWR